MKALFLTAFLVSASFFCFAQSPFYKVYDQPNQSGEVGLAATLDGKFVMTGTRQSFSGSNDGIVLFKTNENGEYLWHHVFDSTNNYDDGRNVIACADSGFLCIGTANSFSNTNHDDIWVVKTDKNGTLQWSRTIDGGTLTEDRGESAIQAPNGSFIVTGIIDYNTSALSGDANVINLNASGGIVWKKRLIRGNNQEANLLAKGDHGFYLSGFDGVYSSVNNSPVVTRMDYAGNVAWQKIYAVPNSGIATGLSITPDEGCIVTTTKSIFKVDSLGAVVWSYKYTSNNDLSISRVVPLASGEYIAIGSHRPNFTLYGALYKFDNAFGISWIKDYGPSFESNGDLVVLPNGGGYAFAGIGTPSGSGISARSSLIRTDTNGVVDCSTSVVPPQYLTITTQAATVTDANLTTSSVGYSLSQTSMQPQTSSLHFRDMCNPVAVAYPDDKPAILVFPNPASQSVSLTLQEDSKIVMYDMVGRVAYRRELFKGTQLIEFTDLPAGNYFIVATDGNGVTNRIRLVIQGR